MTLKQALPDTVVAARLTLRPPTDTDIADLMTLANNPNVIEHTATLAYPYRREDGEKFVATLDHADTPRSYAIANGDNRLMGVMLLKLAVGEAPELGYWLGEPYWGRGYASEAALALLDAAKGVAPLVSARVLAANPASIRVLEKVGFTVTERTVSVVARHAGKPIVIMHWRAS
ncbi:GNAT family N-acetyltransferase [Devosia lacusdianchii]|jgi:RimJ/RimL family protein N-acetyltransferase|uniref:GNAT family N-acetyltransferase n=1 Tax=Devosia lacusdianchii TaxID=2917991 RepID=UPI001F06D3B3|nr:GNAT family N-acetyltransferase [Devosia sp. JXJ CY 41]